MTQGESTEIRQWQTETLTEAVLRAADLEASCLRGAFPADKNIINRWPRE